MKKYLSLLIVLILVYSVSTFAKATYSFESEGDDSIFIAAEGYFNVERSSDMAYSGDYSLRVILEDTTGGGGGTEWNVYTARYDDDSLNTDITFNDDTLFVYMYLPDVGSGVMENIQPFTQDNNWAWYGNQQGWDGLPNKDQWDCYFTVIADVDYQSNPRELPIKRSGVQFKSFATEPGCTLYIDRISTRDRSGSGIELITDPSKVILETSINTIKFSLAEPTPVLLSVYNLMGAKVSEIAPGGMSAGPHEVSVSLPNGMYIVKIVAGKVRETSRLLILK
jgi:hypothetical protein